MQHHRISQMSPGLLWSLLIPSLKLSVSTILSFSDPKPSIMSDQTCLVLTSLVGHVAWILWLFWAAFWHHEIWKQASSELELLWFRHIWSLIMPDYVNFFRHNFGIMRLKKTFSKTWFLHLWTFMMPIFGSHDAKMMPNKCQSQKINESQPVHFSFIKKCKITCWEVHSSFIKKMASICLTYMFRS